MEGSRRMPQPPIIVVGASAGGVEALRELVAGFPPDLGAAVYIILHTSDRGASAMPAILRRKSTLPVSFGEHGLPIEAGQVIVAPPGHHLVITEDHIELTHGPKENGLRPAADTSLRSAARSHGERVVGVILSGTLDDGTAGAAAVRRQGGRVVVQDPDEALYDGMPRSVIAQLTPDHVLPVAKIGATLGALVEELVERPANPGESHNPGHEPRDPIEPAAQLDAVTNLETLDVGPASAFSCPECNGVLWEGSEAGVLRFRCRVGHIWSPSSLIAQQDDSVESALWAAIRALEERASLCTRVGQRAEDLGHLVSARHFAERAREAASSASAIRQLLATIEPAPVE
jgi:two-component system chemotaxis response regulator CheB